MRGQIPACKNDGRLEDGGGFGVVEGVAEGGMKNAVSPPTRST